MRSLWKRRPEDGGDPSEVGLCSGSALAQGPGGGGGDGVVRRGKGGGILGAGGGGGCHSPTFHKPQFPHL